MLQPYLRGALLLLTAALLKSNHTKTSTWFCGKILALMVFFPAASHVRCMVCQFTSTNSRVFESYKEASQGLLN